MVVTLVRAQAQQLGKMRGQSNSYLPIRCIGEAVYDVQVILDLNDKIRRLSQLVIYLNCELTVTSNDIISSLVLFNCVS